MKSRRILVVSVLVTGMFMNIVPASQSVERNLQQGLFDCFKPANYSKIGTLTKSFKKSVESKTSKDWYYSYLLARLYSGNPKCFNSKDVQAMSKIVRAINDVCAKNPSWGEVCYISGKTGKLANWVYDNL